MEQQHLIERTGQRSAYLALRAGLAATVLLLAGCASVGPNFEAPTARVESEWVDEQDSKIDTRSATYRDWWTVFNDAELTAVIETAYRQNLTLQAAGLRILEARALLGIAVGSLYPQSQELSGGAGSSRISLNGGTVANLSPDARAGVNPNIDVYQLGFDAAWELDFWGRFRRGVEAADANLAGSIADYDDVLVTLLGDVAATYVQIRTLEERLEVARENVSIQKRSLEIADVRFRNGLTTELDAQQALSLLRSTQAAIPILETSLRQAKNALGVLLGLTPREIHERMRTPGTIPVAPTEVAVGIPAELLRRRPDIVRAELIAASQSANIGVAQADLYPAFILAGNIGLQADSSGNLFESDSRFGTGIFGFKWPVLNYGRQKNRVRVQDARFQALVATYRNTVLEAAREVEDGLVAFLRAQDQVGFLTDGVQAAQRAVELSEIQYRDGVADYTRVLNTQQTLVQQQDRLTAARGDIGFNLVSVYKALGGGWQIRQGEDFIPETIQVEMRERTDWGRLLDPDATEPPAKRGLWRRPDW